MRLRTAFLAAAAVTAAISTATPGSAGDATTERISVNSSNEIQPGDSFLWKRSISADASIIAFESEASYVASDTDNAFDVYVRNRDNDTTELVSVRSNGDHVPGPGSYAAEISANGQFVVFESGNPLVSADTNEAFDVYLHNRETGKTTRISVQKDGDQVQGQSFEVSISPNGRYVAFMSDATNLVSNDDNLKRDIFLHDRTTKSLKRVSIRTNGGESNGDSSRPSVSNDGDVAFYSVADNLVADDENEVTDVFVRLASGKTKRVSVSSSGEEGDGTSDQTSISKSGNVIAFRSEASNFKTGAGGDQTDIFVRVLSERKTRLVSKSSSGDIGEGSSNGYHGMLSYSGRYVAFDSRAENLVSGDDNEVTDMFWHDRESGITKLVSVTHDNSDLDAGVYEGSISGDGQWVAFDTDATNVDGATDPIDIDVFLRGPMQ